MSAQPITDPRLCDHCGTETIDNCPVCGAPQCCPKCCRETTAQLLRKPADERLGLPSASSMHRAALCPGSVALEAQCPPEPPGPDAERGTRIHRWLSHQDVLLTQDEMETAIACVGMTGEALRQWEYLVGDAPAHTVTKEERLWLQTQYDEYSPTAMRPVCSGQPDVVYAQGNRALVIDYKTLWGDHDPAEVNYQLRTLAVLVAENSDGEIDEVTVLMVRPNVSRQIKLVVYTADDLLQAREEILGICEATKAPDAPRIPGESQCRHCRGKLRCPEAREAVNALGVVGLEIALTVAEPLVNWPQDSLARYREICLVARIVDKAVEDEMKRRLAADPNSVPGWMLAEGNKRRHVEDVNGLYGAVQDDVSETGFLGCVDVQIGALEELFVVNYVENFGGTKKAARDAFRDRTQWFITLKQNAPSLKRTKELPE